VFTSTHNIITDETFEVYPNPANAQMTINIPDVLKQSSRIFLSLTDANGKEITQLLINNDETFSLNVEHIPAGVYTLQLSAGQVKLAKQVLIQH
jgi:hypothetical protein